MFDHVKILNLVSAMAGHAAQRHSVIAENIANADTPDFKAKEVESFEKLYARAEQHAADIQNIKPNIKTVGGNSVSPNGNTVSLENQMMQSSEAKTNHDLALAIYRKSLDMIKMSVSKNL